VAWDGVSWLPGLAWKRNEYLDAPGFDTSRTRDREVTREMDVPWRDGTDGRRGGGTERVAWHDDGRTDGCGGITVVASACLFGDELLC